MPDSSEDFEPYQILKRGAQKVRDFVGTKSGLVGAKPGPAKQRSPEEVAAARKEADSRATDIQNVKAYNRSMENKPGSMKMIEPIEEKRFKDLPRFEGKLTRRKLPPRSTSR